ncbi:hypothetical protein [Niallia circulans]|uniref:Uncharacterized protein n=1 Tax=Niallia circulans TaxID=1397 RepID=A0A941GJZ4_NIACI|nr:hypothetical protein [Niallia circulans]MCB5239122.1 hypothetical protein [Niallia circulans]
MHHPLSLKQQYLHGSFSNSYKPILTVESGDSITLKTLDIEWGYSRGTFHFERWSESVEFSTR